MAEIGRREALGNIGKAALAGVAGAVAIKSTARAAVKTPQQYGMLVDLRRCMGCQGCTVACKAENEVPLGVFRRRVRTFMDGSYPEAKRHFMPISCFHCKEPPCLKRCKENAIYKTEEGFVLVDPEKCKKKKRCLIACPYRNIFINPDTKKADKCTMCAHRVREGVLPACVQTCTGNALMFGDLNDPSSDIAKAVAANGAQVLKPEAGTGPSFYYVGLEPDVKEKMEKKILRKRGQLKPGELENDR